ncbi:MAG: hypothetical protein C0596_10455 [Marinilabiliales bacterium]|nr:MAG: hypothetical protein C0596_10455 [Marinilabiliales bacterium]
MIVKLFGPAVVPVQTSPKSVKLESEIVGPAAEPIIFISSKAKSSSPALTDTVIRISILLPVDPILFEKLVAVDDKAVPSPVPSKSVSSKNPVLYVEPSFSNCKIVVHPPLSRLY